MAARSITFARPYARAAFEHARGAGALVDWQRWLAFCAAAVVVPGVAQVIDDPRLDANIVTGLITPEDLPADSAFAKFLALLVDNRRITLMPEIAALFDGYKRDADGVLKVEVTSAVALDEVQRSTLSAALARRYQRDIELSNAIDPALIGGARIRAGGEVIDGSVRGRLDQLAQVLAH